MGIWVFTLNRFLNNSIKTGALELSYPNGDKHHFGQAQVFPIKVRICDNQWVHRIVLDPELALGEAYMHGGLRIENDDIYGFLDLIWVNILTLNKRVALLPTITRMLIRRVSQFNPSGRAQKNSSYHYDIGNDFYSLFLDEDLQYSCGYFDSPEFTLEQAQSAKCELIMRKLVIQPGQKVLEIGSGWGGLGMFIGEKSGANVDGIMLAQEQLIVARSRAKKRNLSNKVKFRLLDFRQLKGRYDRIVSVGMFEHVGVPHYREYFDQVSKLLNKDGVALIHTIGRPDNKGITNPWIAKYIFPGGYIPALSEMLPHIEKAGLIVTDIEVWRLHYAETLKEWRKRFRTHIREIELKFNQKFARMWDFYLSVSELSFRHGAHIVFQIQLAKKQDVVPLTRRYLFTDNFESVLSKGS